ncbi:MAG: Sua5/YciO/YrdC/YwlC family protein [Gammaproteobacteria bacterium]|nr:Sua5/YciO/YrdC/YwlC family protein [Gammaproteobacteria bacterium]
MISAELQHAARVIQNGGIVAYATEYCFGFGCDPMNRSAVLRLLRLKRRSIKKGLILIAADVEQLACYTHNIPAQVLASWPGPHTWLLEPRENIPRWIKGEHPRLATRVTAHAQAAALCHAARMTIVSTSANRAGDKPTRSFRETVRRFKSDVDYVLAGRVGKASAPTPIRDAVTLKLIRAG